MFFFKKRKTKKKDHSLLEENKRLKAALNASIAGLIYLDKDLDIKFVNQSFLETSGYEVNDLLGKDFSSILPENMKETIIRNLHLTEEGKEFKKEIPVLKKDGSTAWLWAIFKPTKDKNGNIDGLSGATREITKQKEIEVALEKRAKDLERVNKLMIDRELKMKELKEKIKVLEAGKNTY